MTTLFDESYAPWHLHDPSESIEAAMKVDAKGQLRAVVACLAEATEAITDDEIAQRTGLLRHSAGTRRGIAGNLGFVVKAGTGLSALGNRASTWVCTEKGRAWIAEVSK